MTSQAMGIYSQVFGPYTKILLIVIGEVYVGLYGGAVSVCVCVSCCNSNPQSILKNAPIKVISCLVLIGE